MHRANPSVRSLTRTPLHSRGPRDSGTLNVSGPATSWSVTVRTHQPWTEKQNEAWRLPEPAFKEAHTLRGLPVPRGRLTASASLNVGPPSLAGLPLVPLLKELLQLISE